MEISQELIAKAKKAKSAEEIMKLAKDNGIEISEETAKMYFEQICPKTGELSDEELDNVAGGACYSNDGRLWATIGHKCKYYEENPLKTTGVKGTCCRCRYWGVDPLSASLWTEVIDVVMEVVAPRQCYHPKNMKKS